MRHGLTLSPSTGRGDQSAVSSMLHLQRCLVESILRNERTRCVTQGDPVVQNETISSQRREFLPRANVVWQIVAYIGGGVLIVLFGLLMLVLDLASSDAHSTYAPGMFGGVSVAAIFSIGYGVFLLTTPSRVVIDERELLIDGRLARRRIPWEQIATLAR